MTSNKGKAIDIFHVYAGTAGISGTYLQEIVLALELEFSQDLFVNYRFPFKNSRKIFYRYSELSSKRFFPNGFRLVIRYLELFYGLILVFKAIVANDVRVLSYNLTSDLRLELFFLKLVKWATKTRIVVVCHDVLPFTSNSENLSKKKLRKQLFFQCADFLIVHNENSINELRYHYSIEKNIIKVPFPLMNIEYLREHREEKPRNSKGEIVFGMMGYFRREKGVLVLIEAWKKFFQSEMPNAHLLLAGYFPEDYPFLNENMKKFNVVIQNNYLSDYEYYKFLNNCDIIVLPYSRGTNSGILSTVASLNKPVILSDIPLFKENSFFLKAYFFEKDNSEVLASVLSKAQSELVIMHTESTLMDVNNVINYKLACEEKYRFAYRNIIAACNEGVEKNSQKNIKKQ